MASSSPIEPQAVRSRPTTSEEFAYHALRMDILTGRISAGTRVIQSDVARELGLSVTPVREAMRRLQSEGLVELTPHKGATVGSLDLRKAREVYELRLLLEPLLVDRAVLRLTVAELDGLAELCAAMDETDSASRFAELNQQFHDGLIGDDDSWLARVVKTLRVAASPYVAYSLHAAPETMAVSNAEHARILRSYRAHDVDAAREVTIHHLAATMLTLEDHL